MIGYVFTFIGGVTVGVIADRLIDYILTKNKVKFEEALVGCFGEPVVTNSFSLKDVNEWLKQRKEKIQNECKGFVVKATSINLKKLGIQIESNGSINNMLIIAIINNENNNIEESILIKYDSLDADLENILAKGDGTLVVGG